jgi:lipopolysaccharide export LptBFGC system permease protein LptF
VAIKSAGVSLQKAMRAFICIYHQVLSIASFLFSDYMLAQSQPKIWLAALGHAQ